MIQRSSSRGFTLIELMLAMSFVGMLLIAIAVTTMQIMKTYNKGVTIREVNQVGRTITDDIQASVAVAVPFSVEPKIGEDDDPVGSSYVQNRDKSVPIDDEEGVIGGRLCTGTYTYVWNYGKVIEGVGGSGGGSKADVPNKYKDERNEDEPIRLVKVRDIGGFLCADMSSEIDKSQSQELLSAGDRNLAVQAFDVVEGSRDYASGQALYAISLTLGTNVQEQLEGSKTCLPPNQGSGYEDFCAINQFNIIARAGNRSGSL